ncbi:MAG: hypothetical protein LBD20_07475 [Spirochaetaceae bacterium]|nr:hypothetical protein [Spirochaetaceae bacterium]
MTDLPLLGGVIAFTVILGIIIMVAIGFGKYGMNFLKYGFKQGKVEDIATKIDTLRNDLRTDFDTKIDNLRTDLRTDFDTKLGSLHTDFDTKMGGLRSDFDTKMGSLRTDFDTKMGGLRSDFDTKIGGLRTEFRSDLEILKTNHFGHLKNFLSILTGVLLDNNLIDNETKARLDNELRGM